MPKDRSTRSASTEARSRASPYPCSSSRHRSGGSSSSPHKPPAAAAAAAAKDLKEWDEVRCPVCMEHPHNAVLLVCASSTKGCRPFMCDTSYRHSNCLDQYRKASLGSAPSQPNEAEQKPPKLSCPLCRGAVTGWTVVEPARRYMNSKLRSCSTESCGFSGAYRDIRKHARTDHPSARPADADPERERDWRRMEQQRDIGDLVSTIRSAIGGEDDEDPTNVPVRSTTTVLFILRFRGPGAAGIGLTSTRSGRATVLWEETISGPEPAVIINSGGGDDDDDDNGVVDSGVIDLMPTAASRRHPSSSDDDDDEDLDM